jgi:hypothetical protein
LREKSREERFDEVFQMVLIIVALSFDILWAFGNVPLAEIAVFIFVLIIWGYGNLRGGMWEYPLKLGSFELSIILLTNFYSFAIIGEQVLPTMWKLAITAIIFPIICLLITLSLAHYLSESIDRRVTRDTLIGGTLGYMISMSLVIFFGIV